MALIKCPECGNNVSDKASVCIHCGFPLSEYVINSDLESCEETENKVYQDVSEIYKKDILKAKFVDGHSIFYDNGKVRILHCGRILFEGKIIDIKIYYVRKELFSNGIMKIVYDQEELPKELYCFSNEDFKICKQIKEIYDSEKKKQNDIIESQRKNNFSGVYKYGLIGQKIEVYCANCGSSNCSEYKDEIVVPEKTKTTVSMNLNPLKPFTFANVNEKVVRNGYSIPIKRFVCNDCGKIFN